MVLAQLLDALAHDAFDDAAQYLQSCDDRTRDYLAALLLQPPPIPTEVTTEAFIERLLMNAERRWKQQRFSIVEQEIRSGLLAPEQLLIMAREMEELRKYLIRSAAQVPYTPK